jgi:hypothetical protein
VSLAIATGIPVREWAAEEPATVLTAVELLNKRK